MNKSFFSTPASVDEALSNPKPVLKKQKGTRNMRHYHRIFSLILVIVFVLTACQGNSATGSEKPPLRFVLSLWPGVYPAAVAYDQGLFAKHGVEVEVVYYESYPQSYSDLAIGKVDGLGVAIGDALLISEKIDIKFIFPADYSDGADQFVVTSDIQSAADLKGKRIGVNFGTYGDLFVRTLLEQNGLSVTDVTLVNVPAENVEKAFPSQVDAVHTYEPFTASILKDGAHVLFTSHDTPGLVLDMVTFPAQVVKDRPEDIQAFTTAWFEAVDWINANPDQAVSVIAKVLQLPEEYIWFEGDPILTRAQSQSFMQPGKDSSSAYFVTQTYIDFLTTSGILTSVVTPEELTDPSFIK